MIVLWLRGTRIARIPWFTLKKRGRTFPNISVVTELGRGRIRFGRRSTTLLFGGPRLALMCSITLVFLVRMRKSGRIVRITRLRVWCLVGCRVVGGLLLILVVVVGRVGKSFRKKCRIFRSGCRMCRTKWVPLRLLLVSRLRERLVSRACRKRRRSLVGRIVVLFSVLIPVIRMFGCRVVLGLRWTTLSLPIVLGRCRGTCVFGSLTLIPFVLSTLRVAKSGIGFPLRSSPVLNFSFRRSRRLSVGPC